MNTDMSCHRIALTFSGYIHLQDLLKAARTTGFHLITLMDALETALNRAEVVASTAVFCPVLAMDTCALLTDTTTGEHI